MVNRLAGLVVLGACGWGAVVLFLCAVQLAGETVAWVANGGLGRLPGWSWPLIAAGVLGLVGVAWFRWLWPGEVGEEVERRGEEPGAAVGGIGLPACPRCGCVLAPEDGVKCPCCGGAVVSPDEGEKWIQMQDLAFQARWAEFKKQEAAIVAEVGRMQCSPVYQKALADQRELRALRFRMLLERLEQNRGGEYPKSAAAPGMQATIPYRRKPAEGQEDPAPASGPAAMAEFLDATTKEREGRGGA